MAPRILLTNTTWWECASRLAITLKQAGCDIAAVCPRGHPLRKTAAVEIRFPYSALNPLASLTQAIREYQPDFLVPADDRAVGHLHELYAGGANTFGEDFAGLIRRSLGKPASYPIVSSRFPLLEIAQEEGLRVPKTNVIRTLEDLDSLRPRPAAAWVLKSDGSSGGHGVAIIRDPKEARRYFQALAKPVGSVRALKRLMVDREAFSLRRARTHQPHIIAQEFIRGVPANSGFFCWEGKVLADIHVQVLRAQGDTGPATVVRVIDNAEMTRAAERLAGRLGLSGFFGLDFIIEEASGAAFLIELNPRCTPLSHLRLGEGLDMVAALSAQLTGQPIEHTVPVTQEDTIVYFPQAWNWDRSLARWPGSFHDVPWEDPALIQELLQLPWPDRGLLARLSSRVRHTRFAERASRGGGVFEAPVTAVDEDARSEGLSYTLEPASDGRIHLPAVVPLRPEGTRDPLFLIHGVDGSVAGFNHLVTHLEPGQRVYGVLAQSLLGDKTAYTSVEEMARYYLRPIQAMQPQGPYHLLGYSFGGYVAFEMARQLQAQGEQVGLVGLIDNQRMASVNGARRGDSVETQAGLHHSRLRFHLTRFFSAGGVRYAKTKLRARCLRGIYTFLHGMRWPIPPFLNFADDINWFAATRYVPQPYPGKVTLFPAHGSGSPRVNDQWHRLAGEGVEVRAVPGSHENMLSEPQVEFLAKEITDCLSRTVCGSEQFQRT